MDFEADESADQLLSTQDWNTLCVLLLFFLLFWLEKYLKLKHVSNQPHAVLLVEHAT
jgi:hypothetical protein